jgi:cytohesin
MGTAKIVEMLLKHGASVNAVGAWMQTPLHCAAEVDSAVPMLKVLLAAGAKHNIKDKSGNTPLHLAAFNFNAEGVRLLLAGGADPRVKNREGKTPIEMIEFRRAVRYPTDSLDWNKFWAAIRCDSILGTAVHK